MNTFSIVVPVYYNELNLPETIPQLLGLADKLPDYRLELVLVDDGSRDRSLDILLDYQARFSETIKVVKLTRNFGSMAAIQAGLTVSTGDCVGMISADLQDPPELFLEMIRYWEKGSKAVFAIRQDRQEPFLQKFLSNSYYSLVRRFSIPEYPDGGFDFFVIDRQVVNEVNRLREKNTNLMALIFWLGFKPIMLPYLRLRRVKGKSRWTFSKKIKLFTDTFVGFSFFPIRFFSFIGFLMSISSVSYGIFVLIYWLFFGIAVKGWVPLIAVITFTAGIEMAMLGVLGEYLWRVMDEVRRRPPFVIDNVYDTEKVNSYTTELYAK